MNEVLNEFDLRFENAKYRPFFLTELQFRAIVVLLNFNNPKLHDNIGSPYIDAIKSKDFSKVEVINYLPPNKGWLKYNELASRMNTSRNSLKDKLSTKIGGNIIEMGVIEVYHKKRDRKKTRTAYRLSYNKRTLLELGTILDYMVKKRAKGQSKVPYEPYLLSELSKAYETLLETDYGKLIQDNDDLLHDFFKTKLLAMQYIVDEALIQKKTLAKLSKKYEKKKEVKKG